MKIYKITKPETNKVYIGQTKLELKERLRLHLKEKKLKPNRIIYQWLDKTCTIELLEEFESERQDTIKEMQYVQEYITNGFVIMNTLIGKYTLNPEGYIKEWHDKNNAKYNNNKHPDYNKWITKITKLSKKEGLKAKEYRKKYNIPDYTGPKKINDK